MEPASAIKSIAKLPEGGRRGATSVSTLKARRPLKDKVNSWRASILEFHRTASQMDLRQLWAAGVIKYKLSGAITHGPVWREPPCF